MVLTKEAKTNPGSADLIAEEHQAPGRRAGAHGWSSSGGHAKKAAAAVDADVEVGAGTSGADAGGILGASPLVLSLSSATFMILSQTHRHSFPRSCGTLRTLKWTDTRTVESFWRATEEC